MFLTGDLLRESEDWKEAAICRSAIQEGITRIRPNHVRGELVFNERIPASALDLEDKP